MPKIKLCCPRVSQDLMSVVSPHVAIAIQQFWKWRTFRSYVVFFLYTFTLYSVIYFSTSNRFVVELTGALSQLCDGMIAAPQAWKNCVKQSVKNLRCAPVMQFHYDTLVVYWGFWKTHVLHIR